MSQDTQKKDENDVEIIDSERSNCTFLMLLGVALSIMIIVALGILITSCAALPQFFQAAEDIADDEAIKIEVSREAINKQTNIELNLDISNDKDSKK